MLQISKINDKQYEYQIKKVLKRPYNNTHITKMSIQTKEKDGTYTTFWINVWGADLDVNGYDFDTKSAGDKIVILGIDKIALGFVYKETQPIDVYCKKEDIVIIKSGESIQPLELTQIKEECLPF